MQTAGPRRSVGGQHVGVAASNKAFFSLFGDTSAVHAAPGIEIRLGHQQRPHPSGEPLGRFNRDAAPHTVAIKIAALKP